jgi:hypothetical protein
MKMRDAKTEKLLERFWICFTHPEFKDKDDNYIPQGYAEISIEILPKTLANEIENGLGRDGPNQHPVLPDPTGRFKFVRKILHIFAQFNDFKHRTCFHPGK